MEIGLRWIVAIIIGLIIIYMIYQGVFQKYIPAANEAANVKVALLSNDLVRACRDWAGNLVLDATMSSSLKTAATTPDIAEEDRWDFCQICYESSPRPHLPCRQCKAACVKLLIDESACRTNPGKFDTFKYSSKEHTAVLNGQDVAMNYNSAYLYCISARIGTIKDKVEATVT